MIEYVLAIYLFVYCPLILYFYSRILSIKPQYLDSTPEQFKPFVRYDVHKWNKWQIYFGALVLLPPRLFLGILSLLVFQLFFVLTTFDFRLRDPWPAARYHYARPILCFLGRMHIFFQGFHYIPIRQLKYSDFDPEYKQSEIDRLKRPSLIVSNHFTWYDTIIHVSRYLPSFVSKESVKFYPVYGWITTNLKSIYVRRDVAEDRLKVISDMKERIQQINEGQLYPPIIIFPEGTTSNGKYLLSFKRGAFDPLEPIKLCLLKYQDGSFNMGLDTVGMIVVAFMSLVQWQNKCEILEFEGVYNPEHLHLEKLPEEERWHVYAERVKDIMAKALGKQKSNSGFRESKAYAESLTKQKSS